MSELDDLIAAFAAEAGAVALAAGGEMSRSGTVFAMRGADDAIELRLGEEIAEAARRTPDTDPSPRGADWVRFAPREWDGHARDRLGAWLRVAWRNAGEG